MYDGANSAPQQTEAVAFGTMYMLQVIESEIDTDRTRTENVSNIVSNLSDAMASAKGADQVSSLCLYGSVAILGAIAYEKDTFGVYSTFIRDALDSLTNSNANSAPQEMANASYRMVDMLSIIAYEEGVNSKQISNVNDTLSSNNKSASGAPQQTANGLYRSAELIYLISQKTSSSKVANLIDNLLDDMYESNNNCKSALQQITNGMKTIYYMLMAIAYGRA